MPWILCSHCWSWCPSHPCAAPLHLYALPSSTSTFLPCLTLLMDLPNWANTTPSPPLTLLLRSRQEVSHCHFGAQLVDHSGHKELSSQAPLGDPAVGVLHPVEPLEWGMVGGVGEGPSQKVVFEGTDCQSDCQTILFHGTVQGVPVSQISAIMHYGLG